MLLQQSDRGARYAPSRYIERARKEDCSTDTDERYLQLDARAHIAVQEWIDEGGLNENVTSFGGIIKIHRRFYKLSPEDLLWVEDPETKERIKIGPGKLRRRDGTVGRHIPVSPGALPRFMERLEDAHEKLGRLRLDYRIGYRPSPLPVDAPLSRR